MGTTLPTQHTPGHLPTAPGQPEHHHLHPADDTPTQAKKTSTPHQLRKFRPDIEGLRAVAVLSVVIYHVLEAAGVHHRGLFSGGYVGVDVFFVISGFLITRQLLTELEKTGKISITGFYARRVRRLLPASTVVVISTLIAGFLLLNPLRARGLVGDALWTLVYMFNWILARDGTDYLTATDTPSALQHFWSLAVEEQFYMVWPLIMLVVTGTLFVKLRPQARHRHVRPVLAAALVMISAASLALSVWQTTANQPYAYFGLHTRAWELAAGALVAVGAQTLTRRVPTWLAMLLSWAGLGMIIAAVMSYTTNTTFPGYAATLPVAGTALVIAAGCAGPRWGAERVLDWQSMQFIGAMSYGWYLWHWPILIVAPSYFGKDLDVATGLLMAGLALGLTWLTYVYIEHPIRVASWPSVRPWRALGLGAGLSALTAAACLVVVTALPGTLGSGTAAAAQALTGDRDTAAHVTEALYSGLDVRTAPANLDPALDAVREPSSLPLPQQDGCHLSFTETAPKRGCVYGAREASRRVVLLGDSHALQWFPALEQLATQQGFALVSLTKSACSPMSLPVWNDTLKRPYTECEQWREAALQQVRELHPDTVVISNFINTSADALYPDALAYEQAWARGTAATVRDAQASGARVVVLGDTPYPAQSVPNCVADNLTSVGTCTLDQQHAEVAPGRRHAQAQAAQEAGATVLEPTPWLCVDNRCPVIVGTMLVYRDESHVSTAYSRWLAPALRSALGL